MYHIHSSGPDIDPLPLSPLSNSSLHLCLVQALFLIELSSSLDLISQTDVLQSCQVVPDDFFLSAQGVAQMPAQGDE
jgi:hypothetical protein